MIHNCLNPTDPTGLDWDDADHNHDITVDNHITYHHERRHHAR